MAARALNLKRLFEGNPIEVREALRRDFVDGRIVVTRTTEGYYLAEVTPCSPSIMFRFRVNAYHQSA